MSILLKPLEQKGDDENGDKWIEMDMISIDKVSDEYPIRVTLLRRIESEIKQPYLQKLMFRSLYEGLPIKELRLEIPDNTNSETMTLQQFNDVKVISYKINPEHPSNKSTYEKITLAAKEVIAL